MSSYRLMLSAATLVATIAAASVAQAEGLIRIEPRPYYGAVVTMERGVRVFRPLPTQHLMIINPDNKTPVNISFNRTIEHRSGDGGSSSSNGGGGSNAGGASGGGLASGSGFGGISSNGNRGRAGQAAAGDGRRAQHRSHIRKPMHH
jgi:uncharacterized membrane protein YgcG